MYIFELSFYCVLFVIHSRRTHIIRDIQVVLIYQHIRRMENNSFSVR